MRQTNKLSTKRVATLATPGMYGDGLGLWLQVKEVPTKEGPSLAKSWVFRYRGRYLGLGPTHTVNLAEARVRARQARQLLLDGDDPIELRRRTRDRTRAEATQRILFKDAAQRFIDLHAAGWRNEKHRAQWKSTLRDYAKTLEQRPIQAIDGALITEALAPIWRSKPETARRVKQRIERIVQWVKDGMPLPRQSSSKRVRHHPAMPFDELPLFTAELRKREGVSARALEFTILTAARTSEAIGAKWSEIDLEAAIWTVPPERMKGGKEHQVPLSRRAVMILEEMPRERGSEYVFPGSKPRSPLSNMAMLELLRGMRGDGFTVHGFRSTFRDWAGDRTAYAREIIEHALAHQIKDKAEAAYRRSAALGKRRRLMEEWARYCAVAQSSTLKVASLRGAA